MREYAHWSCFRRVWSLTAGKDWPSAAEAHYGLPAGTIEAAINIQPADEVVVRDLKAHLLAELDAHVAYLESLLEQTAAMRREVVYKMDDAARAAACRSLACEPHEAIAREILMEGEFA